MSPSPILESARFLDLSSRLARSDTVVASPAAAAETVICTCTIDGDLTVNAGVVLFGWAAWTVGTSGVSTNLKLRQTGTSGTTVKASGALTASAANLDSRSIFGFDASPSGSQVYVLTLTVGSGAAVSTVSAAALYALVV